MFDGLLDPSLGIYAVTAANPKESSWGWYCDKATMGGDIQGKWLGVCLGDEFSVRWMEDTDAADEEHETLADQYSAVQAAVNKSHVMKYGNFSFVASPLSAFLGSEKNTSRTVTRTVAEPRLAKATGVPSRDAELSYLRFRVEELKQSGAMVEEFAAAEHDLANELASREAATALFTNAWARVSGLGAAEFAELYLPPRHFDCHREVVASAELQYTDFSLQYHRIVVNLCEMGFAAANITAAFRGPSASI